MNELSAKPLNKYPRFNQFVTERDHALEAILDKYLRAQDRLLVFLRMRVIEITAHMGMRAPGLEHQKEQLSIFDRRITPLFQICAAESLELMKKLRRVSFTLANAGEAEAISRTLGKTGKVFIPKSKLDKLHWSDTPSGGSIESRVHLAYSRLHRDVLDAFQLSLTLEDNQEDTIKRIVRAFPASRKLRQPQNALRGIKESNKRPFDLIDNEDTGDQDQTDINIASIDDDTSMASGVIDPDTWDDVVSDYLSKELPSSIYKRGPSDKSMFFTADEDGNVDMTERYDWEIENEMTEDFVSSVRAGEVDAANENGISDFMWLAVIDKHTDDCCRSRDGLSTKEIQDKLESGDIDSECDAITPPAHFNCRCRAVPMSDEVPDEDAPDFGSFNDWLESKGNEAAA